MRHLLLCLVPALLLGGCDRTAETTLFPVREGLYREYAYRIHNMDIEIPLRMSVLNLGLRDDGGTRCVVEGRRSLEIRCR